MKAIHLYGPAADATGAFCDAGTELAIAKDAKKPGTIGEDEAKALVAIGRAVDASKVPAADQGKADAVGGAAPTDATRRG